MGILPLQDPVTSVVVYEVNVNTRKNRWSYWSWQFPGRIAWKKPMSKHARHANLVEVCRHGGWRARCVPLEVGCRGIAARSRCKANSLLGITGARKRKASKNTTETAEKAFRLLWIKRGDLWVQATETQVETLSISAGSPGWGCMMLKDPKHSMTPGSITDDVSKWINRCILNQIQILFMLKIFILHHTLYQKILYKTRINITWGSVRSMWKINIIQTKTVI